MVISQALPPLVSENMAEGARCEFHISVAAVLEYVCRPLLMVDRFHLESKCTIEVLYVILPVTNNSVVFHLLHLLD